MLVPLAVVVGLAACHPTEAPPLPPPKPTNPTNGASELRELASRPAPAPKYAAVELLDASIVLDGSVGWDGGGYELDTGARASK
jgi:hypothetical protein